MCAFTKHTLEIQIGLEVHAHENGNVEMTSCRWKVEVQIL